jgi:hypothetical protein
MTAVGSRLRLERYGRRFWAVYENDGLLCVTVYRKGARAVVERIAGERGVDLPRDSAAAIPAVADADKSSRPNIKKNR